MNTTLLPTIYHPATLPSFLIHLLDHHSNPTTLIICCSKQVFLSRLLSSIELEQQPQFTPFEPVLPTASSPTGGGDLAGHQDGSYDTLRDPGRPHALLHRTLHLLASSLTITVAFVTSLPALHAYLSALPNAHISTPPPYPATMKPNNILAAPPTLAIIAMVALHKSTVSYSAQGLGRAFAAAVEAAFEGGRKLVVFEDSGGILGGGDGVDNGTEAGAKTDVDVEMREGGGIGQGRQNDNDADRRADAGGNTNYARDHDNEDPQEHRAHFTNPWEEEIPILDATTKTFGGFGERGLLGRSVKVEVVARRWFVVLELPTGRVS